MLGQTRVIRVRLGPGLISCQQCGRQYQPGDLPLLRYCEACGVPLAGPALHISFKQEANLDPGMHHASKPSLGKPRAKKMKIRKFKVTRHEIVPVARDNWFSYPFAREIAKPVAQLAKASWVRVH